MVKKLGGRVGMWEYSVMGSAVGLLNIQWSIYLKHGTVIGRSSCLRVTPPASPVTTIAGRATWRRGVGDTTAPLPLLCRPLPPAAPSQSSMVWVQQAGPLGRSVGPLGAINDAGVFLRLTC